MQMIVMLLENGTSEPATDTDAVLADSKGTTFLRSAGEPINIASDFSGLSSMPCWTHYNHYNPVLYYFRNHFSYYYYSVPRKTFSGTVSS